MRFPHLLKMHMLVFQKHVKLRHLRYDPALTASWFYLNKSTKKTRQIYPRFFRHLVTTSLPQGVGVARAPGGLVSLVAELLEMRFAGLEPRHQPLSLTSSSRNNLFSSVTFYLECFPSYKKRGACIIPDSSRNANYVHAPLVLVRHFYRLQSDARKSPHAPQVFFFSLSSAYLQAYIKKQTARHFRAVAHLKFFHFHKAFQNICPFRQGLLVLIHTLNLSNQLNEKQVRGFWGLFSMSDGHTGLPQTEKCNNHNPVVRNTTLRLDGKEAY